MSVYAYIDAEFRYDDREAFEKAVNVLKKGGWIDKNGSWLDEAGRKSSDATIDHKAMVITVPDGYYRNLLHHLDALAKGASSKSGCWASSDGMFSGGDIAGDELDLEEWAKSEGLEAKPDEDEYDDEAEYQENLSIWQDEIIEKFMGR